MEYIQKSTPYFTSTTTEVMYDLSILEEMDDNEYVAEILTIFLLETPKDLKEMKEALQAGKADIVCQKAHKLKSNASIIQAAKLNGLLVNIETLGKNGGITNELRCLVDNATHQYLKIENALKIHVQGLK